MNDFIQILILLAIGWIVGVAVGIWIVARYIGKGVDDFNKVWLWKR